MATPPTYHHGNLREAAIQSALDAVRIAGPAGLSLAQIARAEGVTVPALYRHFTDREELAAVVAMRCQAKVAEAIEQRCEAGSVGQDLLRCVGRGYIAFALAEPGWFDMAFTIPPDLSRAGDQEAAGQSGRTPFQLLGDALDQMVERGELPEALRPGAEVPCWSAVHGFAVLATNGPLRTLPREQVEALGSRVVETAIQGIRLT